MTDIEKRIANEKLQEKMERFQHALINMTTGELVEEIEEMGIELEPLDNPLEKRIEEEAKAYSERIKMNTRFTSNERIAATAGFKRGASIISDIILHQSRWRSFTSDGLPEIGKPILVKSKGNDMPYGVFVPQTYDMIHYLCENYAEWKPIE